MPITNTTDLNRSTMVRNGGMSWLNVTAMACRQYDPAIGRFYGIDMVSELTYSITPNRLVVTIKSKIFINLKNVNRSLFPSFRRDDRRAG